MVDRLDFAAMAQTSAEGQLHLRFLVEILLASAIQCEDKEKYIRTIMSDLDHEAQVLLTQMCACMYMCAPMHFTRDIPTPGTKTWDHPHRKNDTASNIQTWVKQQTNKHGYTALKY